MRYWFVILVRDLLSCLEFSLHLLYRNWWRLPFAWPFFRVMRIYFRGRRRGNLLLLMIFFGGRGWIRSLQSNEGHVFIDLQESFLRGCGEGCAEGGVASGLEVSLAFLRGFLIYLFFMMGECFTKTEGLVFQGERRGPSWQGRGEDQNYWRVRLKNLVKLIILIIVNQQMRISIQLYLPTIRSIYHPCYQGKANIFQQISYQNYQMTYFRHNQRTSPQRKPSREPQPVKKWHNGNAPSSIRHNPEDDKDWSETMRTFLHDLLHEQNKSMENMLNSSINHFTRYLEDGQDVLNQNHQLKQQNLCLKTAIEELRAILKQKLEQALKKQREDLNVMMQDYIQLIQKLLKDKEEYAGKIEEVVEKAEKAEREKEELLELLNEFEGKNQKLMESKNRKIEELEKEIQAQSAIIIGSKCQVQQSHRENDELKAKITTLSEKCHISPQKQEREHHSEKTKLLLDMLLQSQQEIKKLRDKLKQSSINPQKDELIIQLQSQIKSLEQQHEQQFTEYDHSMREVLQRKDEYIEKLNAMIFSYRKQLRPDPSSL